MCMMNSVRIDGKCGIIFLTAEPPPASEKYTCRKNRNIICTYIQIIYTYLFILCEFRKYDIHEIFL